MRTRRVTIALLALGTAVGCKTGRGARGDPTDVPIARVDDRAIPRAAPSAPCAVGSDAETLDAPDAYGRRVRALCIHGVPPAMLEDVRTYLRVKPGWVVTEDALASEIRALFDSGFFRGVEVTARPSGSTVDLHFALQLRPVVRSFEIVGAHHLPADHAARSLLEIGRTYDPGLARSRLDELRAFYSNEGFAEAKLELSVDDEPDGARVRVDVVEGLRDRVGSITLKGIDRTLERDARAMRSLTPGTPLTTKSLEEAQIWLIERHQDLGYLWAEVKMVRGARGRDGAVPVTVEVADNGRYRIGKVRVVAPEPTIERELLALVQTKPGAIALREKVRADRERVLASLRARGRDLDVVVDSNIDATTKTVDVAFDVVTTSP